MTSGTAGPFLFTMARTDTRTLLVAGLLVIGLLAPATVGVASGQLDEDSSYILTIDENTGLTDQDTIKEFQRSESVTADVPELDMQITVTTDKREISNDAVSPGLLKRYIAVDYNEEIARTVRFYVPAEYVTPRIKRNVDADGAEVSAEYEPVDGGNYMAVTVYLGGETEAILPANEVFGSYVDTSGSIYGWVENKTGVPIPQLGKSGQVQWQYPPEHVLQGANATYHIPMDPDKHTVADMTIQYDNSGPNTEPTWLVVPACEDTTDPVCVTPRNETAVLFTSATEAPPVRYKHGTDRVSEAGSAWHDLKQGWDGLIEKVGGLVGGLAG